MENSMEYSSLRQKQEGKVNFKDPIKYYVENRNLNSNKKNKKNLGNHVTQMIRKFNNIKRKRTRRRNVLYLYDKINIYKEKTRKRLLMLDVSY